MEKTPLRIAQLAAVLAATALFAGCASAPPKQPAPAPVVEKPAPPAPLVLKPDYPQRYVVVKGDTLWDIAARFLKDPWRWPELWNYNPQIANPHLIYPGDVLTLIYIGGRPVIQVQRATAAPQPTTLPEVTLEPKIRVESLDLAVPTIPLDAIRAYLTRPRVVTQQELDDAPYIISSEEEHLIAGTGNKIYVRGLKNGNQVRFVVVRPGETYRNPANPDDILGHEATHVADATLLKVGDPSTLRITSSNMEVLNGDLLLPVDQTIPNTRFLPHGPAKPVTGQIIGVPGGVSLIGLYQVVVLDLGTEQGMDAGTTLAVYQKGESVRDPRQDNELVKMPDERAGIVMVFRAFDRVSYALVMNATRTLHVLDRVTNPD